MSQGSPQGFPTGFPTGFPAVSYGRGVEWVESVESGLTDGDPVGGFLASWASAKAAFEIRMIPNDFMSGSPFFHPFSLLSLSDLDSQGMFTH